MTWHLREFRPAYVALCDYNDDDVVDLFRNAYSFAVREHAINVYNWLGTICDDL